ncbi:MAG: RNA polymerase sigma-70 factor [Chloroflexota bacterium]
MPSDPQTFETYRPLLFSIAYRMLGSAMEAEDMVQETYLRYEMVQDNPIEFPKAYLSKIVTRLCLDQLKSAKTQRENYVGTWLPEPLLTGESTNVGFDERETISMAFLVLLENLSPIERAIFLLRDVFDYSYAEIAVIVGKSEANCRRYYHRAKQYLTERRPRFEPSSAEQHKLIEGFIQAITLGDVEGLTELLAEDVVMYGDGGGKAAATRHPLMGREAVIRLMFGSYRLIPPETQVQFAEVNGTPSLLFRQHDTLFYVINFTIVDNKISAIRGVLNPDKLVYLNQHSQGSQSS